MAVSEVHHVCVRVTDLERSLQLYQGVLGLTVATQFTLSERRFALLRTPAGSHVELMEQPGGEAPSENCVHAHFALSCDNIETTIVNARSAGYTIAVEPTVLDLTNEVTGKPWSIQIAFIEGPDGESLELFHDLSA